MSVPVVESVTTTAFAAGATSLAVQMPATVNPGDLLLMALSTDGSSAVTGGVAAGFHLLRSGGSACRLNVFAKRAVGNEDGTTVTMTVAAAQDGAAHVYRISNYAGWPMASQVLATDTNATPDASDANPNWGVRDVLAVLLIATDADRSVSAWPANYTDNRTVTASGAGDANGATMISASRQIANEDVVETAVLTLDTSEDWVALCVVVAGALEADELGFFWSDGSSNSGASTPDENSLDITGDIDIRMLVVAVARGGGEVARHQNLIAKGNPGSTDGSWLLRQQTGALGDFRFSWRESGGTIRNTASAQPAMPHSQHIWIRCVLDVDDGGQYKCHFYNATEGADVEADDVTWDLLNTVTGATGPTSIFSGINGLRIANRFDDADERLAGHVMYAEIRNGIDGTKVVAVDFRDRTQRVSDTVLDDGFREYTLTGNAIWFLPPEAVVEEPFVGMIIGSPPYVIP